MAHAWKVGDHFTYQSTDGRVYGTISTVRHDGVSAQVRMPGDPDEAALNVQPQDAAEWQPLSAELFATVRARDFALKEEEFQKEAKADRMKVRRKS